MKASVQVGTCTGCGATMRKQSAKPEDHPGTKQYGANGMCSRCYQRARRGPSTRAKASRDTYPCADCARVCRPRRTLIERYPNTVQGFALSLCVGCYDRKRRGLPAVGPGHYDRGTDFEAPRGAHDPAADEGQHSAASNFSAFARGMRVDLVRWVRTPDGDAARVVSGVYVGRTATAWHVAVLGEVVEYDRTVWEVTVP